MLLAPLHHARWPKLHEFTSPARQRRYRIHIYMCKVRKKADVQGLTFTCKSGKGEIGVRELGKRGRMIGDKISGTVWPMLPNVIDRPKALRTETGHWAKKYNVMGNSCRLWSPLS